MTHKTHNFKQEAVFLNPGPSSRITSCTVVWQCRCNETKNVEYTFRKPSGRATKPTEDERYAAEIAAGKGQWPQNGSD